MQFYKDSFHRKQAVSNLRLFEECLITEVHEEYRTYSLSGASFSLTDVPYASDSGILKTGGDELLQVWDRVMIYSGENKPIILFKLPDANNFSIAHAPVSYSNVTPSTEAPDVKERLVSYRNGGAFDAMPGEFLKYGPDGGVISVLRGPVVKIGASTLSQIQLHGIDDLTRIISRNMDVYTDFGEKRIYNDEGEVNVEIYGAAQQFETMGSSGPGEEIGSHSPEAGKSRYRIEPHDRMGRWRIHAFAGWLGDNLRLFITRRGDSNKRLETESSVGLAEVIVSHDGAIRVRSAREMVFEKVSRIRVPKKIREPHDNEFGDTKARDGDYKQSLHKFYQWDNSNRAGRHIQYVEWHNHYVDHEENRRFRDHKKDWFVESETSAKLARKAKDIFEGKEEEPFEETSASFRIGNDGSIYAEDTWGSILSMSNEDIVLSARRDIKIQAGRDFQISGIREGTVRSQEDLDLVSHEGTLRAKGHIDFLAAADTGNASLDSGQGNVSLISRQKDVLIRAERENIVLKADLQDIRAVAVSGEINLRAAGDIQVASDGAQVKIHGSSKAQVTSGASVLVAVGEEVAPLSMTGQQRDIGRFTDTTLSLNGNSDVDITNLEAGSYLELLGPSSKLHAAADNQISSSNRTRVFSPNSRLNLSQSGYRLSSGGNGSIVRNGNQEITQTDSDGDQTWNLGGSHAGESTVEASATSLAMTDADIQSEAFAQGRFRYKDQGSRGDLIKNYTHPWNNEGDKVNITKDLLEWDEQIPSGIQEIPDIGTRRPVDGDSQGAIEEEEIEQVAPYSRYVKYNDGSFSFDDEVIPGCFEETTRVKVPTSWEEAPKVIGRLNAIPTEAQGESFGGVLDRSDFEDVVNSEVNNK